MKIHHPSRLLIGGILASITLSAPLTSPAWADYVSAQATKLNAFPGSTSLLGATEQEILSSYKFDGPATIVPVEGQEFSQALRVVVKEKPKNDWNVSLRAANGREIKTGDTVLLTFFARAISAENAEGLGSGRFGLQKKGGGDPSGGASFSFGSRWERFSVPIVAKFDYPVGGAELNFQLGQQVQTLEFGGLSVFNLGQGVSSAQLTPMLRPPGADYLDKVKADLTRRGFSSFTSLVGEYEDQVLQSYGFDQGTRIVPVEGQPFKKAHRLVVEKKGANEWSIQLRGTNATPIAKGDTIFVTVTARCLISADEAKIGAMAFGFKTKGGANFSGRQPMTVPPQWQTFNFAMKAGFDYPAQSTELNFMVGGMAQTLEVGGIGVFNMGQNVATDKLPKTVVDYNYAGRAADAPWRKAAHERIEKNRKADIQIKVLDAAGKPVPNAQVKVAMKKHAFVFGVAENARDLVAATPSPDQLKLQENIQKYFNTVTFANDLKMPPWTGEGWAANQRKNFSRQQTLEAIKWLRERGLGVRGHTLVWPSWGHTIPALKALENDKPALRKAVDDHIRDIMGATKGQIVAWDVINEPFMNNDLMRILGPEVMAEWFVTAKEVDPAATLYINEAGAEQVGAATRLDFLDKIKFLKEKGAPVEGIGLQAHFSINAINPPENLLKVLDQFGQFNLPIAATELDVDVEDPKNPEQQAVQADYLRDVLTVFFSHPQVTQIVQWGFWEKTHWKKNAALFDKDWNLRPVGQAYVNLVTKDWWTNAEGKTGAKGQYATRGFLGDYDLTVSANGKTQTLPLALGKNAGVVTVVLR